MRLPASRHWVVSRDLIHYGTRVHGSFLEPPITRHAPFTALYQSRMGFSVVQEPWTTTCAMIVRHGRWDVGACALK